MQQIHASAVALEGRAALILGDSGSGKSRLALKLMAMGCVLVGDDQVYCANQMGIFGSRPIPMLTGASKFAALEYLRRKH